MTELLVVIGLIVLLLALAIPAFSFITGSRSIDGAVNQISAFLGRARADAIGLQEVRGVFFFIDPATQRINMAMVRATPPRTNPPDNPNVDVYLDVVHESDAQGRVTAMSDFMTLPPGVGVQLVDDCAYQPNTTNRLDDGYIGFNTIYFNSGSNPTLAKYGGVILFDGNGQVISRTYAFRIRTDNPTGAGADVFTAMAQVLWPPGPNPSAPDPNARKAGDAAGSAVDVVPSNNAPLMHSQFGLVLYDQATFENRGFSADDPQITGAQYKTSVDGTSEENWLDTNASPVLINRYNGTVIRGE